MDLKEDIFLPVASRIRTRADSLRAIKRFARSGIEGWLKVEAVAALDAKIKQVQNTGPDLELGDGTKIELKAATNFELSWIIDAGLKYKCPCLFLGDGKDRAKIEKINQLSNINLIGYEIFSDGESDWVIGIAEQICRRT
jgi:hypothetical protein